MNYIWCDVLGYEGIYVVSECGLVKSLDHNVYDSNNNFVRIQKGRLIKQQKTNKGYLRVSLSKNGKKFTTGVHRLVLISFKGFDENKQHVNHIDGNKENNHLFNLEWVTNQENQIHAIENNLTNPNLAEKHHNSKLTNEQIKEVRHLNKIKKYRNIDLANMYNISAAAMSKILRNKTYINI